MKTEHENKTLLLIDDDKNILKSLVRVLAQDGYDIHSFTRPVDALSMLQQSKIGVIISDQCMPQMEGSEFLRQAAHYQPLAVRIILSGYYDDHSAVKVVNHCNAWRYLPKPWSDEVLRATVTEAFERFNA